MIKPICLSVYHTRISVFFPGLARFKEMGLTGDKIIR